MTDNTCALFYSMVLSLGMDGVDPGPSQRDMQLTDVNTNIEAPDTFECEPSPQAQFQGEK